VHLKDEDNDIVLVCSLPRSFESFKDIVLYGKEGNVTFVEVQADLRTKELTKSKDLRENENNEGFNVSRGNGVEVEVTEEAQITLTSQSISAISFTR